MWGPDRPTIKFSVVPQALFFWDTTVVNFILGLTGLLTLLLIGKIFID